MISLLVILLASAHAGRRNQPPEPPPPRLEEVLERAGWTLTPERASSFHAGDIYDLSSNSKVASRERCFKVQPEESAYTSLHVVQAMKASASVRLGMVEVKGGGSVYKQRTYAEPYIQEIPLLAQKIEATCTQDLSNLDTSTMVLLTAVLSAEVKEENCRTLDAGAKVMGNGGELGGTQQCVEESAGHVAIAYKTRPIGELLTKSAPSTALIDSLRPVIQRTQPTPPPVPTPPDNTEAAAALLERAEEAALAFRADEARTLLANHARDFPHAPAFGRVRLSEQLDVVGKSEPIWLSHQWFQGEYPEPKQVTLAVFWEPWCPYSKREMPRLEQIHKDLAGRGLQVVGYTKMTRDATSDDVRTFLEEGGITFAIGKESGSIHDYMGVTGVPAAVLLKDGKVVWRGHPMKLTTSVVSQLL